MAANKNRIFFLLNQLCYKFDKYEPAAEDNTIEEKNGNKFMLAFMCALHMLYV